MDPEERARRQVERDARKRARETRKQQRRSRREEAKPVQPPPGRLLQWVTMGDDEGLEALAHRLPRSDVEGIHLGRLQRVLRAAEAMLEDPSPAAWQLLPRLEAALEPPVTPGDAEALAAGPTGTDG